MEPPQLENNENQMDLTEVYTAVYNIIPKNDYLLPFPKDEKKRVKIMLSQSAQTKNQ